MRKAIPLVGALALAFAVAVAAPAHAQNLVLNPGFETNDFTDWTTHNAISGTDYGVDGNPHTGNHAADFGAVGSTHGDDDTITQNIPTTAGDNYSISFFLAYDGNNTSFSGNDFHASWNGVPILSLVDIPFSPNYTEYSFVDPAAGGSTPLEFGGRTPPSFWYLDDITVLDLGPSGVPEPGPVALLVGAVLGGSLLLRRRAASRQA